MCWYRWTNLDAPQASVHNGFCGVERGIYVRVGDAGWVRRGRTGDMAEFLATPLSSVILLLAVTAAAVAVGVYVIGKVRASLGDADVPSSEMLTKFEDLHSQGELSDAEYRTIKAMLAERLERELNSTDRPR